MLEFRNPANGYSETVSSPGLFTLLFGCIYFAVKGVWTHAVAGFFLCWVTFGASWLVYPFFAKEIMRTHYLRRGWEEVDRGAIPHERDPQGIGRPAPGLPTVATTVLIVAAICAAVWLTQREPQAPSSASTAAPPASSERPVSATETAPVPLPKPRPH